MPGITHTSAPLCSGTVLELETKLKQSTAAVSLLTQFVAHEVTVGGLDYKHPKVKGLQMMRETMEERAAALKGVLRALKGAVGITYVDKDGNTHSFW